MIQRKKKKKTKTGILRLIKVNNFKMQTKRSKKEMADEKKNVNF